MTWRPLPAEGGRAPRKVGDSLDRATRSLGGPSAAALATLFGRWAELVGVQIAAHSRPLSLRKGVLTVAVDQPAWATQLNYFQADMIARIDEAVGAGTVTRIAVQVRPS